jgi:hypothetical protein
VASEDVNDEETRRISWGWVLVWTGIGVVLLCMAGTLEGLWNWTGVSIDILVHVGATLLLAPLLPFLERSLTRRVVQANRHMVQQETAGLRQQVDSLATRIDQLQANVEQQEADHAEDQNRVIEGLSHEASFMNVASAMAVANELGALPKGEVTIAASAEPRIDLTFSWQYHMGDGRFSEPSGNFLGIEAKVYPDPGGMTPVIRTIWRSGENPETVIARINDQLRERDRWNGTGTINWTQVFRDLHRAVVLAAAYKRRDTTVDWQLHGGLYELHGQDWAITEAGIEYRPDSQVVLAQESFPEGNERRQGVSPTNLGDWAPPPPAGADPAQWRHLLWRGLFHLPVWRGPVLRQPSWYPCKTMPKPAAAKTEEPSHTRTG